MLDRQKGDVVFECDICGNVLETETSDFESARNLLRREGWRTLKVGDVWMHKCPSCQS
jgi:hypothetical protein